MEFLDVTSESGLGGGDFFARSPFSFKSEIILGAGLNEIVLSAAGKRYRVFPRLIQKERIGANGSYITNSAQGVRAGGP